MKNQIKVNQVIPCNKSQDFDQLERERFLGKKKLVRSRSDQIKLLTIMLLAFLFFTTCFLLSVGWTNINAPSQLLHRNDSNFFSNQATVQNPDLNETVDLGSSNLASHSSLGESDDMISKVNATTFSTTDNSLEGSQVAPTDSNRPPATELPGSDKEVVEVCAVAPNPRQGSLFRANVIEFYGSGKYTYRVVEKAINCPLQAPRVQMISYIRCCQKVANVQKEILNSSKTFDVVMVAGDEYCFVNDLKGYYQYRQYWGDNIMGEGGQLHDSSNIQIGEQHLPMFLPLGPRAEFKRVDQSKEIIPSSRRKYLVNFVGSPTSASRKNLKSYFDSDLWHSMNASNYSFVKFTDKWSPTVDVGKGFVDPEHYRSLLLDSVFTLCPDGHNPEAYRIYEACEAGSIPIIVVGDPIYEKHHCTNAFRPFVDSEAPFIVLNSWEKLPQFLLDYEANPTLIDEMQLSLREWYERYMQTFARGFEDVLEKRYAARMERSQSM